MLQDTVDGRAAILAVARPGRRLLTRSVHGPWANLAHFIFDNSLLLLAGTIAAVTWANLDLESYEHVAHPLHFWVNDVGMVFFFALAAKEVFEATLRGGALASPRRALSPLAAAVGGMAAPALIYSALASTIGPGELLRGWGDSMCHRYRVLSDGRARDFSRRTSGDPIPVAARDR